MSSEKVEPSLASTASEFREVLEPLHLEMRPLWNFGSSILASMTEQEQVDHLRNEAARLIDDAAALHETEEGGRLLLEGQKLRDMLEVFLAPRRDASCGGGGHLSLGPCSVVHLVGGGQRNAREGEITRGLAPRRREHASRTAHQQ